MTSQYRWLLNLEYLGRRAERFARSDESVVCVDCGSETVIKKGKTGKDAQRYRCKNCETMFNDLTDTVFEHRKFPLEEMFYIIRTMQSEPIAQIARDLSREYDSVRNFAHEVRDRDEQMLREVCGADALGVAAGGD